MSIQTGKSCSKYESIGSHANCMNGAYFKFLMDKSGVDIPFAKKVTSKSRGG